MDLTDAQDAQLRRFADAVTASPHNLVSRRARDELWTRHIPECLAVAAAIPTVSRILDLGSGGGFPGMVVAIARPDLDVHLLDSVTKKTSFLEETKFALGVSVTVHTARAEDRAIRAEIGASFPLVTARALAPLERLVPWAWPFLAPGGRLWALKGARWAEELAAATPILERLDAEIQPGVTLEPFEPGGPTPLVVSISRPGAGSA
ncbi:MAG: 16S rRNA (guanine(527)-N(7))-methyltransferase RsmG [Nitriliruptoraceae bacterium]|nr:16S rRNA (guanine(527)-N(7))-methyltransferase RsmG [Nitriliruptoraceae bacterium]